ncbi:sarcosine dehydrogenase, mitochondrial [Agrilus planipennis]|uniref:Sarcosine dehydrogenase, mitochondrial n=1 Tax=Agrilus planipennis TaxID=224129 RepID=A0A1W4X4R2_AGRPL|nr:sarcosine dehydrogenase, mitochondrial [Agrilus planipennis]
MFTFVLRKNIKLKDIRRHYSVKKYSSEPAPPVQADVVIIGAGNLGCNTLYQLSKKGIKAVLLEKGSIISGPSWHAGLFWSLKQTDLDCQLLTASKRIITSLEKETGINPGWINNGGLMIAREDERINEYLRIQALGRYFGIESKLITPEEAAKLNPILDPSKFLAALYSTEDGCVDPNTLSQALLTGAQKYGGKIYENCPATRILTEDRHPGYSKRVVGVVTPKGTIRTNCVVNAAGLWSRDIVKMVAEEIPLVPIKHTYVVTEAVQGIEGTPNIRDMDGSTYFRIQGSSICIGGYEQNPEILREVEENPGLLQPNITAGEKHLKKASYIAPSLEETSIKKTVSIAENFTPDSRPIMGEDGKLTGLFHATGFSSSGIMLGSGCAEQLAIWIKKGRPDLPMFPYDIRRYSNTERTNRAWMVETCHESYAKNYAIKFPLDQKLSGRNLKIDVFHEILVANGAVMEQAQGWERPAYFIKDSTAPVRGYDWYGHYDHMDNPDKRYEKHLKGDYTFGFSRHHNIIKEEALTARNSAAIFNLSSYKKLFLTGPDAERAANWLFTGDTRRELERVVYSCALNSKGGVEANLTITRLPQGQGSLVGPMFKGVGYYIVASSETGYHTYSHIQREIEKNNFRAHLTEVTPKIGILSIQGPKSGEILQSITENPITNETIPVGMSMLIKINGHVCRVMRVSTIGELGFQLHIPFASCIPIYHQVTEAGRIFGIKFAGFRALNSLTIEKGYHLWGYDLRNDDNPVEAGLGKICRKNGSFLGKDHVDRLQTEGVKKRWVFITLNDNTVPLWGMEPIWRDDVIVGYIRRGDYGFYFDCSIGVGYISRPDGEIVDDLFLSTGRYEVEVMNKRHSAVLYKSSPFDPLNQRIVANYEQEFYLLDKAEE